MVMEHNNLKNWLGIYGLETKTWLEYRNAGTLCRVAFSWTSCKGERTCVSQELLRQVGSCSGLKVPLHHVIRGLPLSLLLSQLLLRDDASPARWTYRIRMRFHNIQYSLRGWVEYPITCFTFIVLVVLSLGLTSNDIKSYKHVPCSGESSYELHIWKLPLLRSPLPPGPMISRMQGHSPKIAQDRIRIENSET